MADKKNDSGAVRNLLRWSGVEPRIAQRGEAGFGAWRWPIEQTSSCLKQDRRLGLQWDQSVTIHEAFLSLVLYSDHSARSIWHYRQYGGVVDLSARSVPFFCRPARWAVPVSDPSTTG